MMCDLSNVRRPAVVGHYSDRRRAAEDGHLGRSGKSGGESVSIQILAKVTVQDLAVITGSIQIRRKVKFMTADQQRGTLLRRRLLPYAKQKPTRRKIIGLPVQKRLTVKARR